MNLVLRAASPHAGTVDLLALLKHPLAACGVTTSECRTLAREAEVRIRQGELDKLTFIKDKLKPLTESWRQLLPIGQLIALHIHVCETIAETDEEGGASRLWHGDLGDSTTEWLDEWRESGEGFPPIRGSDYAALFGSLSSTKTMRAVRATHPRLSILGPLEARLINADLVILGGLNEGSGHLMQVLIPGCHGPCAKIWPSFPGISHRPLCS